MEGGAGIFDISFIPNTNPNQFIGGCRDGIMRIWDMRIQYNAIRVIAEKKGEINSIQCSDTGQVIFSGTENGDITAWDIRFMPTPVHTLSPIKLLNVNRQPVYNITVNPINENQVAFQLRNCIVGLVDISAKSLLSVYNPDDKVNPDHTNLAIKRRATFMQKNRPQYCFGNITKANVSIVDLNAISKYMFKYRENNKKKLT